MRNYQNHSILIEQLTDVGNESFFALILVLLGGIFAGFVNAIAGGGSSLTLPLMMEIGVPPSIANGSNRPSVWFGTMTAALTFRKHLIWNKLHLWIYVLGAITGILGALASVQLADNQFRNYAGIAIILATLAGHFNWLKAIQLSNKPAFKFLGFVLTGLYGGFFQAGVGLMFLAVYRNYVKENLIQANAAKAIFVLCYTIPVTLIFSSFGKINWPVAIALTTGTILGTLLSAKLALKSHSNWIRWVVLIAGIVLGFRLIIY
jgi:hypothetical protein